MKKYIGVVIIGLILLSGLGFYVYYHISNYFHPSMNYAISYKPTVKGIITEIAENDFVIEVEKYEKKEYEYLILRITKETELKDCSFSSRYKVGSTVYIHYDGRISTDGDLPQINKVYGITG